VLKFINKKAKLNAPNKIKEVDKTLIVSSFDKSKPKI
jgi:hypothetical protein